MNTTVKEKHAAERERQSIAARLAAGGRRFAAMLARGSFSGARMSVLTNPQLFQGVPPAEDPSPAVQQILMDGSQAFQRTSKPETTKAVIEYKVAKQLAEEAADRQGAVADVAGESYEPPQGIRIIDEQFDTPVLETPLEPPAYVSAKEKAALAFSEQERMRDRAAASRREFNLEHYEPAPKRLAVYIKGAIRGMQYEARQRR